MKPIQHDYHEAIERLHGLPSRSGPSAVETFALDEKQIVGLASLELEAAPSATIARSARTCRQLLVRLDKKAEEKARLDREWLRKLDANEWQARMSRFEYQKLCTDQETARQQSAKQQTHAIVKKLHGIENRTDQQLRDKLDKCGRIREAGAMTNQVGLDDMHERQLSIAETYNCKVKHWDRSTPRALPSPRVLIAKSGRESNEAKSASASTARATKTGAEVSPRPGGEQKRISSPPDYAKPAAPRRRSSGGVNGEPVESVIAWPSPRTPKAPAPTAKANTVSSRTLKTWLLTEDPSVKPAPYIPPGARPEHRPRTIIQACFPSDYVPSYQRHSS